MKMHPFDKHIADRLRDYSMSVPEDAWAGVQAGLAAGAKRGNRFNPWLFVAVFVAVAALATWIFLLEDAPEASLVEGDTASATEMTKLAPASSDQAEEPLYSGLTGVAEEKEDASGTNETLPAKGSSGTTRTKVNVGQEELTPQQKIADLQQKNIKVPSTSPDSKSRGTAVDTRTDNPVSMEYTGDNSESLAESRDLQNEGSAGSAAKTYENREIRGSSGAMEASPQRTLAVPRHLRLDERGDLTLAGEKENKLFYSPCMVKTSQDCYSFSPALKRLYLDVFAGPVYHISELKGKHIENLDYAEMREDTEDYMFSFTAGVRASMVWQSGITAGVGLSFTQLGEKFDYYDPDAEQETITNVVVDTIVGPGGNITLIWDTLSVIHRGERIIKHPNKYRFLDIPITVGYELEGEHFNLSFNGGIMLNLLFSQKGRILSPSGEVVYLQDGKSNSYDAYKTNAGISLVGSIGLAYKWRDDLHFLVEPQIRYFLKPLELGSYPVEHTLRLTSLRLGIRKTF